MGLAWSRQGDASRAAAREHTKRCRERLRLMREAVRLRRQLASSHAGYLKSLGLVASTLTCFAVGEPLPVSDHTPPAVLVHRPVVVPSTPPPLLRSIEQQQQQQHERQEQDGVVAAEELAEFVDRWGKVLDRVHCAEVLKSIKNFAGSTHALYAHQSDELRVARRVRRYSRELDRKSRMLRQVESSYYDSYVPAGFSMWNRGGRHWRDHDRMQVHDERNEVARRKEEIAVCRRMLEDEMRRHGKAIDGTRASAVTGVQGTLPAVFQAMAAFSASDANALEAVCRHHSNH
ncbi:hypothetical protein ACQ4PT_043943 [Festuca glaucescens]